jgi:DNA polymerase III delta prime subunit
VDVEETIATRLASRDAASFVGRGAELARLEALIDDSGEVSVVLLHGPAGVGKSTLVRELMRRAEMQGAEPFTVEARDLAPLAEALDEAFEPVLLATRPLLLLDSWERMTALDSHLRQELLPRLPSSARVVIASRRAPGAGWFSGGWENLVLDLALSPLTRADADALLAARGVEDPVLRAQTMAWAGGSPLALVLAADAGGVPSDTPDEAPAEVVDALLRRLLDAQPAGDARSALAVAALARVTSPTLLGEVLPGSDAGRAFAWLAAQPSAEQLGDGVTLHDLVGRAVRSDLRRRSPELERDLRRRLVDALYARSAREGLLKLTLDLQHLVLDPAIRWGFAWDMSGRLHVDAPRPGDADRIATRGGPVGRAWLEGARRYFEEAPDRVTVVRGQDGEIAGYGVAATPANAPSFAIDDPVLGPRLRHAARGVPGGAAVVIRQAVDLTRDRPSRVVGMIGMAAVTGSGLANPAAAYLPIVPGDAAAEEFSAACGARSVAELSVEEAGVTVECHVLDYGPGGLLAFQRAAVYRELGLRPPTLETVREALRNYASPARLANSDLAPAAGDPTSRAEAVRTSIDRAVAEAFGNSPEEEQMRRVLVSGYLEPVGSLEQAARELNMSRTAYFRRLRAAVERVAERLGAPLPG